MKRSQVDALERVYGLGQRRINFHGRHQFVDRSSGSDCLVIVLTGYKRHLWPVTVPRLARFLPADVDVCLASPGVHDPEVDALAARRGWSYLSTGPNYPSLALNLVIDRHPRAQSILKVDEDILIGADFVPRMLGAYGRVQSAQGYRIGFVAPTINVNGFSYVLFLEALGLVEAYRARFGPLIRAAGGIPITDDGAAARWVWEHSLPFDEIDAAIRARPSGYSTVPHKFSIGAILFRREFWELFGGFRVRPLVGGIGVDEAHICTACIIFSRVMAVAHDVFAGHFSFSGQDLVMRDALKTLRPGLELQGR